MKKVWNALKERYLEGISWMKVGEGLASMMYFATTIIELLILFNVVQEDAKRYTIAVVVNLALIYLYSIGVNQIVQNDTTRFLQRVGLTGSGMITGFTIIRGLNPWVLFALYIVPIFMAVCTVYMQKNIVRYEDIIKGKNMSRFGVILYTTFIPVITIVMALIFIEMELSVFTKIAITAGFVLFAPLICWADSENYGIFGAFGIK